MPSGSLWAATDGNVLDVSVSPSGGVRKPEHLRYRAEGPGASYRGTHGALLPSGRPGHERVPAGGALWLSMGR